MSETVVNEPSGTVSPALFFTRMASTSLADIRKALSACAVRLERHIPQRAAPIAETLSELATDAKVSVEVTRRQVANEGYVAEFQVQANEGKPVLEIALKYYEGKPVIDRIERVSRSGLRVYRGKDELPKVLNGLGISIVSTSSGIMTDAQARTKGLGGEVIGIVA